MAATTERLIASEYCKCLGTMDSSNHDCEYRRDGDRRGNQSGIIATNCRMDFLDWKVNSRFEILGIVFQKLRYVLVLQSHVVWHCVYMCSKLYWIAGSVYLSSVNKVRHRSVLAEVDMYFIQLGMSTIMEGAASGNFVRWFLKIFGNLTWNKPSYG